MKNITDEVVDRAYDILCEELDHWRVLGPDKSGTYIAVRREDKLGYNASAIIQPNTPPSDQQSLKTFHLKDKEFANACLQWHGLQAVLTQLEIEEA